MKKLKWRVTNYGLELGDYTNTIAVQPRGYKEGSPIATLLFPQCEIQLSKTEPDKPPAVTTIKGHGPRGTVHQRLSAFVEMARREKAAIVIVCDTADQIETMTKFVRQTLADHVPSDPQSLIEEHLASTGLAVSVKAVVSKWVGLAA